MRTCPSCRNRYEGYPALSRRDNKTSVCPECGVLEAIAQFAGRLGTMPDLQTDVD